MTVLLLNAVPMVRHSIGTSSANAPFTNQTNVVSFKEFVLFTGITSIPYGVGFSGCTTIQSIAWPANLRTLSGGNMNSPALKLVEFQDKITTIGNMACFTNSASLTVVCRASTPPSLGTGNNSFGDRAVNRINVYVPDESVGTYKAATRWSAFASKIHPISEYKG